MQRSIASCKVDDKDKDKKAVRFESQPFNIKDQVLALRKEVSAVHSDLKTITNHSDKVATFTNFTCASTIIFINTVMAQLEKLNERISKLEAVNHPGKIAGVVIPTVKTDSLVDFETK